jgi:Flp pilus assembly protein TadD
MAPTAEPRGEETDHHDALAIYGWNLIEDDEEPQVVEISGPPGLLARWRLKKAVRCFEQALAIHPGSWESMWGMGKVHRRLGDDRQALDWFSRAWQIRPGQPDMAREAGLAALILDQPELARAYSEAAIQADPEDIGLYANLSLACILMGDLDEARACLDEGLGRRPGDPFALDISRVIAGIRSGTYEAPRTIRDLQALV